MKRSILAAAWVAGLLLTGSDGPLFPYLNLTGLLIFYIANRGIKTWKI